MLSGLMMFINSYALQNSQEALQLNAKHLSTHTPN
jgi:hypothetical protein